MIHRLRVFVGTALAVVQYWADDFDRRRIPRPTASGLLVFAAFCLFLIILGLAGAADHAHP